MQLKSWNIVLCLKLSKLGSYAGPTHSNEHYSGRWDLKELLFYVELGATFESFHLGFTIEAVFLSIDVNSKLLLITRHQPIILNKSYWAEMTILTPRNWLDIYLFLFILWVWDSTDIFVFSEHFFLVVFWVERIDDCADSVEDFLGGSFYGDCMDLFFRIKGLLRILLFLLRLWIVLIRLPRTNFHELHNILHILRVLLQRELIPIPRSLHQLTLPIPFLLILSTFFYLII